VRPNRDNRVKVLRARELRAKGMTYPEIGRILGVNANTASRWVRGVASKPPVGAPALPDPARVFTWKPLAHAPGCACSLECEMADFRRRALELRIQKIAASYPERAA
jgi:transposase-like protein